MCGGEAGTREGRGWELRHIASGGVVSEVRGERSEPTAVQYVRR